MSQQSFNLSDRDKLRIADRALLEAIVLEPCPLCHSHCVPMIYRARHTLKWMLRPGSGGCHHADQEMFKDPVDHPQVLADGWNYWVMEARQVKEQS